MNAEDIIPTQSQSKFQLSSNTLKYIAIISMTIDHIAWAFVPDDSVLGVIMRFLGRIAGPVMFFAAVEGYHHTRNLNKYMLRLAVFALVSWFPYLYFKSGGIISDMGMLFQPNVIYEILLGILAIHIRRTMKNPMLKAVIILALLVLCIPADWGTRGFIIIFVFDYFYDNFKNQAFSYCMIVLFDVGLLYALIYPLQNLLFEATLSSPINLYEIIIVLGYFLPIILFSLYNGQKGRGGKYTKWIFYVFYPLHLLIIGFLQSALS